MNISKQSILLLITVILICISGYIITYKTPMQELKITAYTTANEFDMSGKTDMYYFKSLNTGKSYTAVFKFMAVKDTSQNLFTHHGTGQYVYLGCDELIAKCDFIAVGKFLHIRMTLNAAQTDLKLEDGTPFDITRYSLRPIFTIEE